MGAYGERRANAIRAILDTVLSLFREVDSQNALAVELTGQSPALLIEADSRLIALGLAPLEGSLTLFLFPYIGSQFEERSLETAACIHAGQAESQLCLAEWGSRVLSGLRRTPSKSVCRPEGGATGFGHVVSLSKTLLRRLSMYLVCRGCPYVTRRGWACC